MSNNAASAVNIGSALAVMGVLLTFWMAASSQSSRLAESVEEISRSSQGTRDAVMKLDGKVDALAGSTTRNFTYMEKLDERVRNLELRSGK